METTGNFQSIIKQTNRLIDWLFKPFINIIPYQTFRYGLSGGANTILDVSLYFIFYNFILDKRLVHLGFVTISPYIAAFLIVFPITFTTGFLLAKHITFTQSTLKSNTQLMRYGITVLASIILNYIFLKVLIESFHIYPTPSKIITTCFVVVLSYFSQKHFTFGNTKQRFEQ